MTYTKDELYEKFKNLPEDIRESFLSIDTYDTIKKIVDKYKLHIDQSGKLSEEIGFVMLGITRPDDFLDNLQDKLGISLETAGEITKDINVSIFFPIRESLEEINSQHTLQHQNEKAPLVENFSPAGQISEKNIPKTETPLSNPNNNAIIINEQGEKNHLTNEQRMFDEKMGKLFRLPKEQVDLGEGAGTTILGNAKTDTKLDPYRELPN